MLISWGGERPTLLAPGYTKFFLLSPSHSETFKPYHKPVQASSTLWTLDLEKLNKAEELWPVHSLSNNTDLFFFQFLDRFLKELENYSHCLALFGGTLYKLLYDVVQ